MWNDHLHTDKQPLAAALSLLDCKGMEVQWWLYQRGPTSDIQTVNK